MNIIQISFFVGRIVSFSPNSRNITARFSKLFIPLLPPPPKTFAGKEEKLRTVSRQKKKQISDRNYF